MLLDTSREVSTTNIGKTKEFSISENSSKLFSMLSSFLYTDKHRAVLTELSSNALDAHAICGKNDVPIELVMPTTLCPEIKIRDFGQGLSEEDVIKFLTTYGESSKQNDKNLIGGYGIGSKSPACVTDTWSINSYHNGILKKYIVFISANGIPSLTKTYEKETIESGLEVSIPVKPGETHKWAVAAHKVYEFYKIKPTTHNYTFNYDIHEIVFESDNGVIRDDNRWGIIVNNRFYTIDSSLITNLDKDSTRKFFTYCSIILKFDPSDISLSLSREDIQYDRKTLEAIKNKIDVFYNEFIDFWEEKTKDIIDEFDYFIEISNLLNKIKKSGYHHNTMSVIYDILIKTAKVDLSKFNFAENQIEFEVPESFAKGMKYKNPSSYGNSKFFYIRNKMSVDSSGQQVTTYYLCFSTKIAKKIVYMLNDATHIHKRVNENYYNNQVIIFNDFNFLPAVFASQVVSAASLPQPQIVKRQQTIRTESEYFMHQGKRFYKVELKQFDNAVKKGNLVYMYFKSARSDSSIHPDYEDYFEVKDKFNDLVVVYIKEGTPIPTGAIHPKDWMMKKYDELEKDIEYIHMANIYPTIKSFDLPERFETVHDSKWNEFMKLIDDCKVHYEKGFSLKGPYYTRQFEILCNLLDKPSKVVLRDCDEYLNELKTFYPMLKVINRYSLNFISDEELSIIKEYINLIGK